jgi:hypothetical protein
MCSLLLNADNEADMETQCKLITGMISLINKGTEIDADEFELFVEDTVGYRAVSVRKSRKLLEQTGAFRVVDGLWEYNDDLVFHKQAVNWEQFTELFISDDKTNESMPILADKESDSIIKGINWTLHVTELAKEDNNIDGLPAFFSCNDLDDKIIGFNAAGTSTSDAISLLCQSTDYLLDCGRKGEEIASCLSFLLDKTLASQCTVSGWDNGGFFPLEDQQESAHPTVDATCLAVIALCSMYGQRKVIEEKLCLEINILNTDIEQAVLAGLDFLFRMQLSDGSFGIYKFENGLEAASNENCTRIVQSTMGVCKGSGIFDSTERYDLYPACSNVISDTYSYLCSHTAIAGEYQVWAPYFGTKAQDYSAEDVIVSTARVCRSFIPVWWQCEDERDNIVKYCHDFLHYWQENEKNIVNKVGRYRFNSPSEVVFSAGEYFWPSHPDMLAAFTALQAYNLFGLVLTNEEWALIERAVQRTLKLQHPHGHWDNPLAAHTPFCAVTLAAIELLQEYRRAKEVN